jgi:hypothetical protein
MPKLRVSQPGDPLEQEADRVADAVLNSGPSHRTVQASAARPAVQRQPDDVQKPRDQPTTFPVEEQAKQGKEKEDAEKEKLKNGALKAAGEFAKFLWEGFSTSPTGQHILAQNEHDWQSVIQFFEDFSDTLVGKIVLGTAAGGAATGAFLGARSARDESVAPDPSSGGSPLSRAPKDEKFFALELNWDFISPPSGATIKTPWLDLPKIGGGASSRPTTLSPAPTLIKPMVKIPNICTPADPNGDQGEAAAHSAQIYSWLLWKQEQEAERMQELLRTHLRPIQAPGAMWQPGQPYIFTPTQPSTITPLFKRQDGADEVTDPRAIEAGLHSSAQALDLRTRDDMEMRFGYDFSRVRVHTDQAADQSARAVNALAYTVGTHVVFGSGRYAPESESGRRLLAHELTHVLQQGGGQGVAAGVSSASAAPHGGDVMQSRYAVQVDRQSTAAPTVAPPLRDEHLDTPMNVDTLAGILWHETRGQHAGMMVAIGWIVINRLHFFGHTAVEKLVGGNQLATLGGASFNVKLLAWMILSGHYGDPTNGSFFYVTPKIMPDQANQGCCSGKSGACNTKQFESGVDCNGGLQAIPGTNPQEVRFSPSFARPGKRQPQPEGTDPMLMQVFQR